MTKSNIFTGCIPALMTPCSADGKPNFDALVAKGKELVETLGCERWCIAVRWVIGRYLTDEQRRDGVRALTSQLECSGRSLAQERRTRRSQLRMQPTPRKAGAEGLMVIPRVLSRGTSTSAQRAHFAGILKAAAMVCPR